MQRKKKEETNRSGTFFLPRNNSVRKKVKKEKNVRATMAVPRPLSVLLLVLAVLVAGE